MSPWSWSAPIVNRPREAPRRHRPGERVQGLDQDARRQTATWERVEVLPRGRVALVLVRTGRQPGRVKLPAGIDQVNVSRASTRMHVGNRPRGSVSRSCPAAVSPGSWSAPRPIGNPAA